MPLFTHSISLLIFAYFCSTNSFNKLFDLLFVAIILVNVSLALSKHFMIEWFGQKDDNDNECKEFQENDEIPRDFNVKIFFILLLL